MQEAILTGIIANIICFLIPALLALAVWGFRRGKILIEAKRFFGMDLDARIFVYVSTHQEPTTQTQKVITAEEFKAAVDLNNMLITQFQRTGWLRDLLDAAARLSDYDLKPPDVVIQLSPSEVRELYGSEKSLILVGGPVRNKLAEAYLAKGNPWLDFDRTKEKFVIRRGPSAGEELDPSGQMAIVNRMRVDDKLVFVAFGFGEIQTRSAVYYLAHNWQALYHEFKEKEFGVCLLIGKDNQSQVKMKLTDDVRVIT